MLHLAVKVFNLNHYPSNTFVPKLGSAFYVWCMYSNARDPEYFTIGEHITRMIRLLLKMLSDLGLYCFK